MRPRHIDGDGGRERSAGTKAQQTVGTELELL